MPESWVATTGDLVFYRQHTKVSNRVTDRLLASVDNTLMSSLCRVDILQLWSKVRSC